MQVKTKNLVVGALVVVLVGMLWYRVVYSSMESKASKAKSAAHDAQINAANLQQAISDSTSTKKTKSHDVSTDVMQAAVPESAAESSFLRSIDALRVSSGADWQSITPAAPTVVGDVATINVGITVQGTEAELLKYASGLGDMPRIFVMDNLSINGSAGPASAVTSSGSGTIFGGASDLQMQVSGRIFAQPSAVPTVGTGTATGTATATPPATTAPASGATAPSGTQNN